MPLLVQGHAAKDWAGLVVVGGALGGQQGMIVALLAASSYAPMAQVDPL